MIPVALSESLPVLRLLLILLLTLTLPAETYRIRHADPDEIIGASELQIPNVWLNRVSRSELTLEGPPEAVARALTLLRELDRPSPSLHVELRILPGTCKANPPSEWFVSDKDPTPQIRHWDEPEPELRVWAIIPPHWLPPSHQEFSIASCRQFKIPAYPCSFVAHTEENDIVVCFGSSQAFRISDRSTLVLDAGDSLLLITISNPDLEPVH